MSDAVKTFWAETFGRPEPEKIVCVGLNYVDHALEGKMEIPQRPLLFAKYASSLVGPDEAIVLPADSEHVDAEAELAVFIGEDGARIPVDRAGDVVAGYTAANDVSARDFQFGDGQWLRGKSCDTFCPILPVLVDLERRTSRTGKDLIAHPPGGHDDVANSVAAVLVKAAGGKTPMVISDAILQRAAITDMGGPSMTGPRVFLGAENQL